MLLLHVEALRLERIGQRERQNHSRMFLLTLTSIIFLPSCLGSHFRGGIIMWKPGDKSNQVIINFRVSWRKSYDSTTHCDSSTVASSELIGPRGDNLQCFTGCSGTLSSMNFHCTDFSNDEDWSAGERKIIISFTETLVHFYEFGFTGGDWITLVSGGGNWELKAMANLTRRSDTGRVNSSPVSAMEPIVRIQHGCNASILIPVHDDDGDVVRCRWARSKKAECGGICNGFQDARLNQDKCKIDYSATGQTGWYAVAIQIEDFAHENDTEPLSSVPLQFLVKVSQSTGQCASRPTFVRPTRVQGSCVGVPFNDSFSEPLVARGGTHNVTITEINTVSPSGMIKSNLAPYNTTGEEWYVNVTWSPEKSQQGSHVFCFTAEDTYGLTSEQTCITLLGGVKPPEILKDNLYPVGAIFPTHQRWSMEFDLEFTQPTRQTFISFYKEGGNLIHQIDMSAVSGYPHGPLSRNLSLNVMLNLVEKEHYYVLMDPGVAIGTTYCGAESPPITDPSFWRVRVRDVTPPRLWFTYKPNKSNENVTLSWTSDEEVTTTCTIQTPNSTYIHTVYCNNSWIGVDLSEGYYTLYIQGTDLEYNTGNVVSHSWYVDRSAPVLKLYNKPMAFSNETSFVFEFVCNENCSTQCALNRKGLSPVFSTCPPGFSSLNKRFDTGTLQENISYVFHIKAKDTVGNEGDIITVEWFTDFTSPVIQPLPAINVSCGAAYTTNVTGIPKVYDNSDIDPRVFFEDKTSDACGIARIWTAIDHAGNSFTSRQDIVFKSPRPATVHVPRNVKVPCGDLKVFSKEVLEPSLKVNHPCNIPVNITYTDPTEAENCGVTFNRTWKVADNCGNIIRFIQQIKILEHEIPLTPQNGQTNIDFGYVLRWPIYPDSVKFRIFMWEANTVKPSIPDATLNKPEYALPSTLRPGENLLWQIEYVLRNNETVPGPRWGFQTRKYPDVAVESVKVPPTAFSGHTFGVRWTIRNIGNLLTQVHRWNDAVFISFTNDISTARMAALVVKNNILLPGDSYTGDVEVKLRENEFGHLFVFVQTDYHHVISELNTANNLREADTAVDVRLSSPPDLKVDNITVPQSTYSGQEITITYTVKNHGTGVTAASLWYDVVYWSCDSFYNISDMLLARTKRDQPLQPQKTYTSSVSVMIPRFIFGQFYIVVKTDASNSVFEYTSEDNNVAVKGINVTLSPPPDLRVVSLQTQNSFYTGDVMHIQWTVCNDGQVPYKRTWFDRIVLQSLDDKTMFVLATKVFFGELRHGSNYTASTSYYIGSDVPDGRYNVTVYVDYLNEIFEYNRKSNNIKSSLVTIIQTLPDLSVVAMSAAIISTSINNILNVAWTVTNAGKGKSSATLWRDALYVRSTSQTIQYDTPVNQNALLINDQYQLSENITLPNTIYGGVYIGVFVDIYSQTTDKNRLNNQREYGPMNVPLKANDIEIAYVNQRSRGDIMSGTEFHFSWNTTNKGTLIPENAIWQVNIILSRSKLSLQPTILSKSIFQYGPLQSGLSFVTNSTISIPESEFGSMFLHLVIEPVQNIFEGPNTNNNEKYMQIDIQSVPSPDLRVENINAFIMSVETSQKILSVTWTVVNVGNTMSTEKKWTDSIYISDDKTDVSNINRDNLKLLETFEIYSSLETQESYTMKRQIVLPSNLCVKCYVYLYTDSNNDIIEYNGEDNNLKYDEHEIVIDYQEATRLSVLIKTPKSDVDKFVSGKEIWIQYKVNNTGTVPTCATSWNDVIYLANKPNLDKMTVTETGVKVKTVNHIGLLHPQESYTMNISIAVPRTILGNFTFYVFTDFMSDRATSLSCNTETDNFDNFVSSLEFVNEQGKLPNLFPSIQAKLVERTGGEPFAFAYNVTNDGEVTWKGQRYDAVYLSDDMLLDPFDRKLESVRSSAHIDVNETRSESIQIFIPYNLKTKNYFLIVLVDALEEIYELNYQDNVAYLALNIKEVVTSDFAVIDVEGPRNVSIGDIMIMNWKVVNFGTQTATGYVCDTAYISDDAIWDVNDEQFGETTCRYRSINPYNESKNVSPESVSSQVAFVSAGNHTTIVKTRSNILDNHLENNIGFANRTTYIFVEEIELGHTVTFNYNGNSSEKEYLIPKVPADESLIIKVTGTSENAPINVKVKFQKPATHFDFDITSLGAGKMNQTVVLPNTKEGNYYLLVSPTESPTNHAAICSVEVKLAHFEILTVKPSKASQQGNVTLRLDGSLFPEDVAAALYNSNKTIGALEVFHFSSSLTYATFDLRKASSGEVFSVALFSQRQNVSAVLPDCFKIVNGIPGRIKTRISLPSALRPGENGLVYIDIVNEGESDLIAPIISINTNDIGNLKFISDIKVFDYAQRHVMLVGSSSGPGGILPPKEFCRLQFEAKQTDPGIDGSLQISVSIIDSASSDNHIYVNMKESMKPSHYSDQAWDKVWNNFLGLAGTSWSSLHWKISKLATQMSVAGRRRYALSDFISFLLEMADNPTGDEVISDEIDTSLTGDSSLEVGLNIRRYMPSKIGLREMTGAFGKGWISPLWDINLVAISPFVAKLRVEKMDYIFISTEPGLYYNNVLGRMAIYNNSTVIFTNEHTEKNFTFDAISGNLRSVTSNRDGSKLNLQFESYSRIKRLTHSNGEYMDIVYDYFGRIVTIQHKNATTGSENRVDYTYNQNENTLLSVHRSGMTVSYEYHPNGYLKAIKHPNGLVHQFQYTQDGHLSFDTFLIKNQTLARKKQDFDGAAKIRRHNYPSGTRTTYTLNEVGMVASIQMDNSLTQRYKESLNRRVVYEGDKVVIREVYDMNKNNIYFEDGNGDSMKVVYDDLKRVKSLTDGDGNVYNIVRNENGTLQKLLFPDKSEETYCYSSNGYQVVTRNGVKKDFKFDTAGRIVTKDAGNDDIIAYGYDENGHIISLANSIGRISVSYDENSYPRSVHYPNGKTLQYEFSRQGEKLAIKDWTGYHVRYVYNEKNLLTDVIDNVTGTILMHAEYYETGQIKLKRLGNGAFTEYTYTDGLLKRQDNFYPNNTLASTFGYQYDVRNRRISLLTIHGEWKFRYDASGQLTYIQRPGGNVTHYHYDNRKNRRSVTINGETKVYKINNMNQYEEYGKEQSFAYDKNGNLIQINGTNSIKYAFDEDNKLTGFQTPHERCSIVYDGFENIYEKQCQDKTIQYLIDPYGRYGPDILAEFSSSGREKYFYHGGNQLGLIAMKIDSEYYYYQFDPLGTVVSILDEGGILKNSYMFEPFGEFVHSTELVDNSFTFIGQWGVMEVTENLYYMRKRFYDAQHGRFLSADPLGIAGRSKNFYAYAFNNPVHYNDPRGTLVSVPLAAGLINTATYLGVQWLTGSQITLGGAVSSFATGVLGGGAGGKVLGMAAKAAFGAVNSAFGYITQTNIDHSQFSWEGLGTSVLNGAITSLIPGKTPPVVSAALGHAGSFLGDPTKSLQQKLEQVEDTWKQRYNDAKKAFQNPKRAAKELERDIKNLVHSAEKEWQTMKQKFKELLQDLMRWIRSRDPNDITGPSGYGAARFVAKSRVLDYKIRFENDENATAPAQRVFIDHVLDSDVDPQTFILGAFGFGNFMFETDKTSSYLQANINLTESYGIFLRVRAGIDIVERKATWELQSVDPQTGSPPDDPQVGFLPPNNGSTGQGFVSFSVMPMNTAPNLARLDAKASIYFDNNEPIDTPAIFNTIDSVAPHVNASVIKEVLSSGTLALSLNAVDEGSGFKEVDILLQTEEGLEMLMAGVNESAVVLPVPPGRTYDLVFSPVDYVGNRPNTEDELQSSLINISFAEIEVSCVEVENCSGHGNCTALGICICDEGYYGKSCFSDTPPEEPPILELMSPGGYEDEIIPIHVLAKLVDGNVSDYLAIIIGGFPNETIFSKGVIVNSRLQLNSTDFGSINATFPTGFAKTVTLSAEARYTKGSKHLIRTGALDIVIIPATVELSLPVEPICFHISRSISELYLNISTKLGGAFQNATAGVTVHILTPVKDTNEALGNENTEKYIYNQTHGSSILKFTLPTNITVIPLKLRITAIVKSELGPQTYIRRFQETDITKCLDVSGSATLLMSGKSTIVTTVIATTSKIPSPTISAASGKASSATVLKSTIQNTTTLHNADITKTMNTMTAIPDSTVLPSTDVVHITVSDSSAETSEQQHKKTTLTIIMSSVGAFVGIVIVAIIVRLCMSRKKRETVSNDLVGQPLDDLGNADQSNTRSSDPLVQVETLLYRHSSSSSITQSTKLLEGADNLAYGYSENFGYSRTSRPPEDNERRPRRYFGDSTRSRPLNPSQPARTRWYSSEILLRAK